MAELSNPSGVEHTLHVEWDPETGTFKGLPEVWAAALPPGLSSEESTTSTTTPKEVAPAAPPRNFFQKAFDTIRGVTSGDGDQKDEKISAFISKPFNVVHETHVGVDPRSSTGFEGLPSEWSDRLKVGLKDGEVKKEDIKENPQAVLDCLAFVTDGPPPKLPSKTALGEAKAAALDIKTGDPKKIYKRTKKLGEGASGVVYAAHHRKTKKRVAIKITSIRELDQLKTEISMQVMSRHPNVVSYMDTYATADSLWMIMEYMKGGPLTDLVGPGKVWKEQYIAYVCKEMLMVRACVCVCLCVCASARALAQDVRRPAAYFCCCCWLTGLCFFFVAVC